MTLPKNIKIIDGRADKKAFDIKTNIGSKDLETIFTMTRTVENGKKKSTLEF